MESVPLRSECERLPRAMQKKLLRPSGFPHPPHAEHPPCWTFAQPCRRAPPATSLQVCTVTQAGWQNKHCIAVSSSGASLHCVVLQTMIPSAPDSLAPRSAMNRSTLGFCCKCGPGLPVLLPLHSSRCVILFGLLQLGGQ